MYIIKNIFHPNGDSLGVDLPKEWLQKNFLSEKDDVFLIVGGSAVILFDNVTRLTSEQLEHEFGTIMKTINSKLNEFTDNWFSSLPEEKMAELIKRLEDGTLQKIIDEENWETVQE